MLDVLLAVLAVLTWVSIGLFAVVVFLARHGRRSASWYAVGAVLGPMMLPVAAELGPAEGHVLRWRSEPTLDAPVGSGAGGRSTVVVALDGSVESDDAARRAARVLVGATTNVVLVTVLDPDDADAGRQADAEAMLRDRAAWFAGFPPPVCEVVSGDPVSMIVERATAHRATVLVLGRRGRGLSRVILGSVADRLVHHAPCPVLLGAAEPDEARGPSGGHGGAERRTAAG